MPMSSLSRRLVWLFVLVGLAASLTSLYVHYRLLANPGYTSFCDVNATVSCTQAYLSRYGSVLGVPVALFGVVFFVFLLVLAALEAPAAGLFKEAFAAYLFACSTIGLAVVLYLGYAAFFILKEVCLMCLTTYVAVIGLFIVSGIATSTPMTTLPRRLLGDLRALVARPLALMALLVFLAGAASAVAFFPKEQAAAPAGQAPSASAQSEFERWWTGLPRIAIPVPADGAAVVIVKFSDYQCPACGQSFLSDRPIFSKYEGQFPGSIKFVAKDYPLQPECNPNVPRAVHLASCDAAAAVRMARAKGKGDALEEYFYTHQVMLTPVSVREAAQTIGGVTDFEAQYPRIIEQVKTDVGLGKLLGIRVTPTFFINGVRVDGGLAPQTMDMAIAYELKKAGKIK
jgi:vitamin-K-epoxide reductase (warfarin-sensitive)